MSLAVLSINHHDAPVAIREKVAFQETKLGEDLNDLKTQQGIESCVILSTCNRSDIYVNSSIDDVTLLKKNLSSWLSTKHQVDQVALAPFITFLINEQAIEYIAYVACGIHSMVFGEPQILGQLKKAYYQAKENNCLDKISERLFQHTFSVAKKIRSQTKIGTSPTSVAYCSVKLAERIFADLSEKTVLLIGAGEMIELTAQHLNQRGIQQLIIANRTLDKANLIADDYDNAHAITLNELTSVIDQSDIIISSTASPIPVIGKGLIESALKQRKHKPIFIVDMAVPRDIEPEVASLNDAYLYTLDDLNTMIKENTTLRQQAGVDAKQIIRVESKAFEQWLQATSNDELIKRYRDQAIYTKEQLIKEALDKLDKQKSAAEVITLLADKLTNKLIHQPSQMLKNNPWQQDDEIKAIIESLLIKK